MIIWAAWIEQVVGLLAWLGGLGCKEQNIDIRMFTGFTWEIFKQECKFRHPRRCEYGGNA